MARHEGIEWGFFFDAVHILSVNYVRQEVRLYENGGSGKNRLLFKKDEPVTKIGLDDPFQLMNLAIHFVVSYDLIAQIADEEVLAFFEKVGLKELLERLVAATTEEDRRYRFTGLVPKFNTFETTEVKRRGRRSASSEKTEDPPPQSQDAPREQEPEAQPTG